MVLGKENLKYVFDYNHFLRFILQKFHKLPVAYNLNCLFYILYHNTVVLPCTCIVVINIIYKYDII